MSAFAVFFLKIATFLGQLGKIRVPACIFRISVPEPENRDRVDSGNRFFGSGFGYPITRAASSILGSPKETTYCSLLTTNFTFF